MVRSSKNVDIWRVSNEKNINGVGPSTVFVNASAIGGFRDEERREAITVVL